MYMPYLPRGTAYGVDVNILVGNCVGSGGGDFGSNPDFVIYYLCDL